MKTSPAPLTANPARPTHVAMALAGALIALLVYSFWNTLVALGDYWQSPQYSHGYLVPVFAAILLWMHRSASATSAEYARRHRSPESRDQAAAAPPAPSEVPVDTPIWKYAAIGGPAAVLGGIYALNEFTEFGASLHALTDPLMMFAWFGLIFGLLVVAAEWDPAEPISVHAGWAGVGLLAGGLGLRLRFAWVGVESAEMATFVPCLAGLMLLVGGWKLLKRTAPAVIFLIFMFPLPYQLEQMILVPLKTVATIGSEYSLQTMGFGAYREGNVIHMGDATPLNIADACSGLNMLTIFMALCVAVGFLIERPWWERIVVMLSSVPIALAANIVRIVLIGVFQFYGYPDIADIVHDQAAFIMMPTAMLILMAEIWVLSRVFIDVTPSEAHAVRSRGHGGGRGRGGSSGRGGPGRRGPDSQDGGDRSTRHAEPVGS